MHSIQKHTILLSAIFLWLCISVRANEVVVAFVNGAPQGILWHDKDNWTMYVSPYMVVNSDRFTKHYYAGSQRIASKIGAGDFNNLYDASKACVTAGQKDYAERMNLITQSRNDYYVALGIPPGPPTAKGIYGEAEYSGMYGDYVIEPLGDYSVPTGWPMKPYKRPYGGTPGPPVMYEKPSNPEEEGAGYGYSNGMSQQERDVFFYHSDHLGSTSYITDKDGNATQFVSYKPCGEALVDEHNTSCEQPWKFNGKELDSETGLYYYGARYYEASLTAWYGPDKLAEDYPSIGSYVYCAGNPVRFVDVDGNDWVEGENGNIYWNDKAISQETTSKGETYLGKKVLVGTHNRDKNGNEPINSAIFDLYLEDNKEGISATIKGNTVPSDITKYGTLAEGLYSAIFGHRNAEKYKNELALRIYNLDGTDGLPTLNGNPSKANSDLLTGVLFHAGNPYQKSLLDSKGRPVWSHGCQTSGCGPGTSKLHDVFMQVVGRNFNGSYYLRAKPQPKQNNFSLQVPSYTAPVDNTYVAPIFVPYK